MNSTGILRNFWGHAPQLLAVFLATMSVIPLGMQYGWTSPMIPRYQTADAPFQINDVHVQWVQVVFTLSGIFGLPITICLVDRIGRKYTILTASFLCAIAWLLIGIAVDISFIYIARVITGTCTNVVLICMPMYVAEIALPEIRGLLVGSIYIMCYIGMILMYSIGTFVPLYVTPLIGGGINVLQLCTFIFMPETPHLLLAKGKKVEAKTALTKLRNAKNESVDDELKQISLSIERQQSEGGKMQDLWRIKSNRKASIIMTILNVALNTTGITPIIMNLHLILAKANSVYFPTDTAAIIFACVLLLGTITATLLVDKFGRKLLLIYSAVICSIFLFLLGLYFHLQYLNIDVTKVSWAPMVCVMLYAIFYKSGMGIVPIVMTSEIYPSKMKAIGVGYANAVVIIMSTLSTLLYHQIGQNFGLHLPFYIFGACTFTAGLVTTFMIPETKGRTLEEIQMILRK